MSKLHEDFREVANDLRLAAKSMNDLTKTLQPLAEHVPVIVEMAHAWEAGKAVGQIEGVVNDIDLGSWAHSSEIANK